MHEQPIRIGTRESFSVWTPVFLCPEDRRAHTNIVGKTGTGKSSLLKNSIEQDLAAGRGVALIDPHDDLAESLLDAIPSHRIGDVTYSMPATPSSRLPGTSSQLPLATTRRWLHQVWLLPSRPSGVTPGGRGLSTCCTQQWRRFWSARTFRYSVCRGFFPTVTTGAAS